MFSAKLPIMSSGMASKGGKFINSMKISSVLKTVIVFIDCGWRTVGGVFLVC